MPSFPFSPLTKHTFSPRTATLLGEWLAGVEAHEEGLLLARQAQGSRWGCVLAHPWLHWVYHSVAEALWLPYRWMPVLYVGLQALAVKAALLLRQDRYVHARWYLEQCWALGQEAPFLATLLQYAVNHHNAQGASIFVAYVPALAMKVSDLLRQVGFNHAYSRLRFDATAWVESCVQAGEHFAPTEGLRFKRLDYADASLLAELFNAQLPDLWQQALAKQPAHFFPEVPLLAWVKQQLFCQPRTPTPWRWLMEGRHPNTGAWQPLGFFELRPFPTESDAYSVCLYTVIEQPDLLAAVIPFAWHQAPTRPKQCCVELWSYQRGLVKSLKASLSPLLQETQVFVKDYHARAGSPPLPASNLFRRVFRVVSAASLPRGAKA